MLQPGEVDLEEIVCNGAPGTPGYASLVELSEDDGSLCPARHGLIITSGVDDGQDGGVAGNGRLEDGEIDPDGVQHVCDGLRGTKVDCAGGGLPVTGALVWLLWVSITGRRRSVHRRNAKAR